MSIIYKKENGYPVDLELTLGEQGEWFYVTIKVNGEEIPEPYHTKYPHETRKSFAKGFFAGWEYAKKGT